MLERTWPRFVLAVFVLALYTSLALASGGVARADEDSPTSDPKPDATTSQQVDRPQAKPREPPKTKRERPLKAALDRLLSPRHTPDKPKRKPTATTDPGAEPEAPTDSGEPPADEPSEPTTAPDPPTTAPVADNPAPTATPEPVSEPEPTATPRHLKVRPLFRPGERDSSVTLEPHHDAGVTLDRADPEPVVRTAPDVTPKLADTSARLDTSAPMAAVTTLSPTDTEPALRPSLGHQAAGLVSDLGTLVLSTVHAAATVVAEAFGPDTFLGVPYLLATTVANAAAGAARSLVGASPQLEGPLPVNYGLLDVAAFFNPTKSPPGANDPDVDVTPEHPLPIILINGTVETQGLNWSVGAPVLANAGYKVYTFNYGNVTSDPNFPLQSLDDIRDSGEELSDFVDYVLEDSGADKVILIGHSQGGGILPNYYINELGGDEKVSKLIGIAPSNQGTDFNGLAYLTRIPILGSLVAGISDAIAPALFQQVIGSPFQDEVYGDGDTRPGVRYTTIASVNDWIVTPYTQQALDGDADWVTNIVLQQQHPGLVQGHINIVLSPQTWAQVLAALEANPEANPMPATETVAA